MNDPRWGRVGELFYQLAERSRDEQEVALAELARSEPEVAAELRSLLTADRHPERIPEPAAFAAPEPTLAPGTQLGPYRIVAELARGGMGVVYRGERADGAFERQVAIKLARPDLVSPLVGARFAEERRILAGLDHPGIARLLGEDGLPGEATRLGLRPLTPEYASPEQLPGPACRPWASGSPCSSAAIGRQWRWRPPSSACSWSPRPTRCARPRSPLASSPPRRRATRRRRARSQRDTGRNGSCSATCGFT